MTAESDADDDLCWLSANIRNGRTSSSEREKQLPPSDDACRAAGLDKSEVVIAAR